MSQMSNFTEEITVQRGHANSELEFHFRRGLVLTKCAEKGYVCIF